MVTVCRGMLSERGEGGVERVQGVEEINEVEGGRILYRKEE